MAFVISNPFFTKPFSRNQKYSSFSMCTISYRSTFRDEIQRARDFLTQRSVQQTMFCAKILRDETTVRWLEEWLGHHGLDDLHDCDALNVSSDDYLISLLNEPPIVLEIKKPIPGRTTNKNPYLKRRYFSYDVEIVPRNMAHRIMEARKQIAEELVCDIPCIPKENNRTVELYHTRAISSDPSSLNSNPLNLPTNGDTRGSPFRSANFDLVKNYTLYLGLTATIQELFNVERTKEDGIWLARFSEAHGKGLLSPYGGVFGVADVVTNELLSATPAIRGGRVLFDPQLLADMVLENRSKCAQIWYQVMIDVDNEHLQLERQALEESISSDDTDSRP